MPAGQSHTIWFQELKDILKNKWNPNLSIENHFDILNNMNVKLNQIRYDLKIQPPMMWCPNCQTKHRAKFTDISITGMYHALKRFELIDGTEFKKLNKEWKKYSELKNLDIYGNTRLDKESEKCE